MKRCSRCRIFTTDFGPNRRNNDGLDCYCRKCRREIRKEDYQRRKKRYAANSRRTRYGITAIEVENLKVRQRGLCAICADELGPGRETHVDHDHETGEVRGLLCANCNKGLGSFRDNREHLLKAIFYLVNRRQVLREPSLFRLDESKES